MRSLIIGINGQDGSYLADILTDRGDEVHGLVRYCSTDPTSRIKHLNRVTIHRGDLTDSASLHRVMESSLPDVIYNVADQDNVRWSYSVPELAVQVTYGGVSRILELIKGTGIKLFQPCSSTIFSGRTWPQNEQSELGPDSPYAVAKLAALQLCGHHRRAHGTFVSTAILFNHDSPRRGPDFLLQKLCREMREIWAGSRKKLDLLYPGAIVDIGYARDYMEAAVKMMDLRSPIDLVIGSGKGRSIREMVEVIANQLSMNPVADEYLDMSGDENPCYGPTYVADCSMARGMIEFVPQTSFQELVSLVLARGE